MPENMLAMAAQHAATAEELLATIKLDKRFGRQVDVKDANVASVAGAHAALALYYQRAADGGAS